MVCQLYCRLTINVSALIMSSSFATYPVRRLRTPARKFPTPSITKKTEYHTHWKWYQQSKTTGIWEDACINVRILLKIEIMRCL